MNTEGCFLTRQKFDGKVGMFFQRFAKQMNVVFGITNICRFQKVEQLFCLRNCQRSNELLILNETLANSPRNSLIQKDRYLLLFARNFNEERNLL